MTTTDPHHSGPTMEETAARWAHIQMQSHDPTAADLCVELGESADPYIYPNSSDRDESRMCDEVSDGKSNQVMRKFLADVERAVCIDRQGDYDSPEINHGKTAAHMTAFLGVPISAEQVCFFNLCQKMSRCSYKITHDSLLDIAGYAANCAAVMASRNPVNGT